MTTAGASELDRSFTEGLESAPDVFLVPIARIRRWHEQPRAWFEPGAMEELVADVRRHGILQPLVVRPDRRPEKEPGGFLLTIGERRWRAAKAAGLEKVPVVIRDVPTRQALLDSLRENVQRRDLTPAEELEGLRRLLALGLDARAVALELSLSYETISRRIRVLEDEVLGPAVANDRLSLSDAFELLVLPPEEQRELVALARERAQAGVPLTRDGLRDLVQEKRRRRLAATAVASVATPRPSQPTPQLQAEPSGKVNPFIPPGGLAVAVSSNGAFRAQAQPRPVIGFPGVAPGPARPADTYTVPAPAAQSPERNDRGPAAAAPRPTSLPEPGGEIQLPPDSPDAESSTAVVRARRRAEARVSDLRWHVEQQLSTMAAIYPAFADLPVVIAELESTVEMIQSVLACRPGPDVQ